jgi:hypothetical protein
MISPPRIADKAVQELSGAVQAAEIAQGFLQAAAPLHPLIKGDLKFLSINKSD